MAKTVIRTLRSVRVFFLLVIAWSLFPPDPVVLAKGWLWELPPHLVTLESGKRNHVFFAGEPVRFTRKGDAAARYEVRDYQGDVVERGELGQSDGGPKDGAAAASLSLKVRRPGWYKLYLFARQASPPWGYSAGATTFAVFRRDPHFPALPPKETSGGSHPALDQVMRGVTGMGPQRHSVNADRPDESIAKLEQDVAIDRNYYLPFDPYRKRSLMAAFPDGTKNLEGVKKIVSRFRGDIAYWEPRNEPNFGASGAEFVEKELKPFHDAVKSVDPKLKVMGPGTVTIGPNDHGLRWIEEFLKAGGANYLDAFSFHAYNTVNGDLWLARTALDSLRALLKKYGADRLEKWQTEQGYFAAVYGSYQPRLQGRWTMLQMMVYEQYGIPKERNHLWYDRSHGFWDFPAWWENEDGGLNPAAPLMRVWSEELYGTRFTKAFDFGPHGNRLYIGSLFTGPGGKRVAAFQSAGDPYGRIGLRVKGPSRLRAVSAFGVESSIPVKAGRAALHVPEIPVYLDLAKGQEVEVVPVDGGPNLARSPGVTAASSGSGKHPVDATIPNDIGKIHNGVLENWYWRQRKEDQPWMDDTKGFPAWVELRFPKIQSVGRVVIHAGAPWQWMGTLLDYELQVRQNGAWRTVARGMEPAKTFSFFSPATRTTVDQYFSDRHIFPHAFPPVRTTAIRLLVHDVTHGGGATKIVEESGGQTGSHQLMLREIEVFGE